MTATVSQRSGGASPINGPRRLALVEPSYEQMLRDAFDLEDDLIDQLARVRRTQKDVRVRYAGERGLLMLPSLEELREVLGK